MQWPGAAWLFGCSIVILYVPTVLEASRRWFTDEDFSHCVFIIPIAAFLLWLQRDRIREAPINPVAWGLIPLAIGLLVETGAYLLKIRYLGMWSLVPTLAGCILILHGKDLWKISRFAVCYLLLAGSLPDALVKPITAWIQWASTAGAAFTMDTLGYTLMRRGNLIEIPGISLEVADVCSGFRKLVTLISFSLLFGYLFRISAAKRLILTLLAIPIAVFVNCIRISGLIAVASAGGVSALHVAHDAADVITLLLAFGLYVGAGKLLGCRTVRFSL